MTVTGSAERQAPTIDLRRVKAVVVDVDGVVADTARVRDYPARLSGRSRHDGIRSFLDSRGIQLTSDDGEGPGRHAALRLGEMKDRYLPTLAQRCHVVAYPSTVQFLRTVRDYRVLVTAASATPVGIEVLRAAGVHDLFDLEVTGGSAPGWSSASRLFRTAVDRLRVAPEEVVVVTDTPPVVEAARALRPRLVVAVDRNVRSGSTLREQGADMVVRSLTDIRLVTRSVRRSVYTGTAVTIRPHKPTLPVRGRAGPDDQVG